MIPEKLERRFKLGVNDIEEQFIKLLHSISVCLSVNNGTVNAAERMEKTVSEVELILNTIERRDNRIGLTLQRLQWLQSYAATFGELPKVVGDVIVVKSSHEPQPTAAELMAKFQHLSHHKPTQRSKADVRKEAKAAEARYNVAPIRREGAKIARNSRCPCGSGKKYKVCCLQP